MYKIAKLTFEAADGAQKDGQLQEQVENYFSALINQGRVAEYFLMQQEGALVAIASLPEEDALSEQYDNKYVKRFSEGLSVHWELIGEEAFDSHVCTCQHPSCYLLDGDGEEDGPVFCGDCGGEVPLYRVPADETQEHASLISWQLSYQAMLTLWCESLSDRFTRRQIEHPASALNREGRRLGAKYGRSISVGNAGLRFPKRNHKTTGNTMKVQYLGTGAAEGVPAVFCNCEYCRGLRVRMAAGRAGREVRSRSQVILDGELSVDFPPDAYSHSLAHGVDLSAIKYLLVTHSHMDHFYAHDFILRGYKYAHEMTEAQLTIFGNAEVCSVFREDTRREMKDSVAPNIDLRTVGAYQELAFEDWRAYTFPAQHSSKEPLLYLIERGGKRVLHLTDTGKLPDESMDFLKALKKRADLVTFDCTFLWDKTEPGARHMGLDEVSYTVGRLERAGIADERTKKVITHFSHNSTPTAEAVARAEREFGFIAAYDGMMLEI